MTRSTADVHGERIAASIGALIDDERHRVAADERRHRHWLCQQAKESGTLAGVLIDLGERSTPVVVATIAGSKRRGIVTSVGSDFVVLVDAARTQRAVALSAITSVRPEPGGRASLGDRTIDGHGTFSELVRRLADERAETTLTTADGGTAIGRICGAGLDVVSLSAGRGELAYVPLAAIVEAVIR